jgi:cytosine/adenosine deaminase-related metal-dependent hydrolase
MRTSREPARVNAHTHLYSGLVPLGMPAPHPKPRSFLQILERVWWRLDRALDADSLRASARYAVAQALLAGTSTLIDHHESPACIEGSLDVLADACEELGSRALLCYGATERNGGRTEAQRGLEECRRFLHSNRRVLVRGAVGLHASFTVSDETIAEAAALCRETGAILHVHVAEDVADVEDARRRGYAGPLERLLQLEALPRGSILAHGVHLDAPQVEQVEAAGCWLVQNPRSNLGNQVGYPRALERSRHVALGTDGYPANMDEEADVLREAAAGHGESDLAIDRRIVAGLELAQERLELDARTQSQDRLWFEAGVPRSLAVAGRTVVEDGKLLTADQGEIEAEARRQASRLWKRMEVL